MTSYKLYLTFLAISSVTVTASSFYDHFDQHQQYRARRSSDDDKLDASESPPDDSGDGYQVGYRFGEEFFLPEASKSVPSKYKKKADGCERVIKDTMVCMVCKDLKTNAKYEQCSYVGNPPPKASRSPVWKKQVTYNPESSSEYAESSTHPLLSYNNYEASTPSRSTINYNKKSNPGSSIYATSKPNGPPKYGTSTTSNDSEENYDSKTPSRRDYESYESSKPEASQYSYNDDDSPTPYSYSGSSKENSDSVEDHPAESSDCRQIEKDSKTCKICKDPKTGRDFERCTSSYQPNDKTYAYGKSEIYGYPGSDETTDDDKAEDFKTFENDSESGEDPAETSDCRQVKKNDETCTICKDPKTGQDSESCSSSYRPADKEYAYGTSETYDGPSSQQDDESYNNDDDDKSVDANYNNPKDYRPDYLKTNKNGFNKYNSKQPKKSRQSRLSNYDDGYKNPNYNTGSEAEYAAPSTSVASSKLNVNRDTRGCHKVKKDSMICTVCANPKTGGNSEKCSYAYQPDDKVYKFTKSKSFGYPDNDDRTNKYISKTDGKDADRSADSLRQSESKLVIDAVKRNPCKQIQKGSMLCTICEDLKTGENSEQCSYGSKPMEKLFTYDSSKSVGNPRNEEQETDENSESASESKRVITDVRKSNKDCRQVQKGLMTCDICKDRKTGAKTQRCAYSSKPKDDIYTYRKLKMSGNPKKSEDNTTEKQLPESAESKQVENITSACKKIEKHSMICTVCKDPVTGENSEQCTYSYIPKKKRLTYSKSNSFGNPGKNTDESDDEKEEEILMPHESRRLSRTLNDAWDTKINTYTTILPDWSHSE